MYIFKGFLIFDRTWQNYAGKLVKFVSSTWVSDVCSRDNNVTNASGVQLLTQSYFHSQYTPWSWNTECYDVKLWTTTCQNWKWFNYQTSPMKWTSLASRKTQYTSAFSVNINTAWSESWGSVYSFGQMLLYVVSCIKLQTNSSIKAHVRVVSIQNAYWPALTTSTVESDFFWLESFTSQDNKPGRMNEIIICDICRRWRFSHFELKEQQRQGVNLVV